MVRTPDAVETAPMPDSLIALPIQLNFVASNRPFDSPP